MGWFSYRTVWSPERLTRVAVRAAVELHFLALAWRRVVPRLRVRRCEMRAAGDHWRATAQILQERAYMSTGGRAHASKHYIAYVMVRFGLTHCYFTCLCALDCALQLSVGESVRHDNGGFAQPISPNSI